MTTIFTHTMHKGCIVLLAASLLLLCQPIASVFADEEERTQKSYQRAIQMYKAGQFAQARRLFRTVLPYLERLQSSKKRGSQAAHLAILGQCDVLYYLGRIAWRKGNRATGCQHYYKLQERLKQVPAGWQRWGVQPNLPGRMAQVPGLSQPCRSVPTRLTIITKPSNARVFQLRAGQWQLVKTRQVGVRSPAIQLKVEAPGHKPQVRQLRFREKRWGAVTTSFVLQRLATVVRRPPPPTPIYKQWWLWTTVGIVAAGAITATVLVVTARPREVLGGPGQDFYPINSSK